MSKSAQGVCCLRLSIRLAMMGLLAVAAVGTTLAMPVYAQSDAPGVQQQQHFSIAAGPLESALMRFSSLSGMTISFTPDQVRGKNTPGIQGDFTPVQALDRLLAGSGLALRQQNNTFSLETLPQGILPAVQVQATGETVGATEGSGSYRALQVSLGKGQSVRETPQSISVMTRQRIEDQGLNELGDVLLQTPGITAAAGSYASVDKIFSRGFEVRNVQVDGLVAGEFSGFFGTPNLAMYDSVEVIRGADGLFSGNGEPGGSINLVRKRPLAQRQISINATAGRWDYYRAEVDVSTPLALDGKVRGRLVASYMDREYFYDVANNENPFFYGIVEADLTENTRIFAGGSFDKRNGTPGNPGMPRAHDGSDLKLPRSTGLFAAWGVEDYEKKEFFLGIEHQFSDRWSLKTEATVSDTERYLVNGSLYGAIDPQTGLGGQIGLWGGNDLGSKTRTVDLHLNGSFDLLGRTHTLVSGVDWREVVFTQYQMQTDFNQPIPAQNVYSFDPYNIPAPSKVRYNRGWKDYGSFQQGIYARVNWSLTDRLNLITGLRNADYDYESPLVTFDAQGENIVRRSLTKYGENNILTPYVGLTFTVNPQWLLYASLTDIYKAQSHRLTGPLPGTPLDAIEGQNMEVGVKGEFKDGRLTTAVSVYRIEQTGEAVRDPAFPSTPFGDLGLNCCWLSLGEVVSEGVDTEVNGEILPGWQISAGYTWNRNKNERTSVVYHSVTPKHLFKLWSDWSFSGALAGWSFGVGATAQSEHFVNGTLKAWNQNSGQFDGPSVPFQFSQGGYAVWNSRIAWQVDNNWSVALNVNNLFDKTWYQTLGSADNGNFYGEPRNAMVTVRGRF